MPLSWNEIRDRAIKFSREWAGAASEQSEKQTFWNEFFDVFGMNRRTVATFEKPVKKLSGNWGFIDLFWPGTLLVEHKSLGQSLDKAHSQAELYIHGLANEGRSDESPRYIIVSDFHRFALHDLEAGESQTFDLPNLHKNINAFGFIAGYRRQKLGAVEDPINVKAVEVMGTLHDALEEGGYEGHDLERFLVRILFCLFAEDTGIFERNAFTAMLENHTKDDGSDLGPFLAQMFAVLNTPTERRQKNLLDELAALPYVNGELFAENLGFASMNRSMRYQLLRCSVLDWSRISPAVFGSLFQSVMEPKERRQVGAHYTSERDILKLIDSLFMDDLREEFEKIKNDKNKLKAFHEKLGKLTFFDPACGCGNFLVVTYREIRLLELEVLKRLYEGEQLILIYILKVDVDAMYGIEINEFPARIAEVAMWLIDHQMNQIVSETFGQYVLRLPLKKTAKIVHGNALRLDWSEVIKPEDCSYILGNPPFIGGKYQSDEQRADMALVTKGIKNAGLLDYVTGWYFKAAEFIKGTPIEVGFVSTNSISQGEQVGVLWSELFRRGLKINFAHRTFVWQSEARKKAHVHVVIIGFGMKDRVKKCICDYDANQMTGLKITAKNISPYLVDSVNIMIANRTKTLCNVPSLSFGSMPNDGGFLLLDNFEKNELVQVEPNAKNYIRRIMGSVEFIYNIEKWCLWLTDIDPEKVRAMPFVMDRIKKVREIRLQSKRPTTNQLASKSYLFGEIRQPFQDYLAIPKTSSERRLYVPIAFLAKDIVANSELFTCDMARIYEFGILTSRIHNSWIKSICGRLKSDYRYSAKLVYNNFPWPESPTAQQKVKVEQKAQAVLDARAVHPNATLADLYDPLSMPSNLVKAHAELDRAVEQCYRPKAFSSDRERVEFLFELYEKLTQPLAAQISEKTKPKRIK
ncbi:MAG: DNA methyltransferase [Planctomycetota bacterium]